jgi:hypothetical protein
MAGMLESSRRPLKPAETRFLRAKIKSLSARGRRTARVYVPITAAITFVLWLITIGVADAPWPVITAFWLVVGLVLAFWVGRDVKKDAGHLEAMVHALESAMKRDAADIYDVRARSFVELEEIEDEGACYAFELEDGRVLFVSGQEFYPGAKFPSLDFSLVYFLDESDETVDMQIEKRGPRAAPQRLIPAAIKRRLEIPEHLETLPGGIASLEDHLETRAHSSEVK